MLIAQTQKNDFDRRRNKLLASLYVRDFEDFERQYRDLFETVENTNEFSEGDQKALNQIQHIFRVFRKQIDENCHEDLHAVFGRIRKILTAYVRGQIKNETYVSFDEWYHGLGLSEEGFRILMKTVSTLQLTVGCSISCRRCNEWALPGPRKHFSFEAVTRLISELFGTGNRSFALYCASDPVDWRCRDKNIADIMGFMSTRGYEPQYGLLTKIPRGSGHIIETLLKAGVEIGFSITDRNRSRVRALQKAFHGQFDLLQVEQL